MKPDQETERSATVDRQRLPSRRGNISFGFEFEGFTYRASAGHFDDGRLAEIFLDVPGKLGTPLQSNANTAAMLASLLLQHGVAPEAISHSISGPIAVALAEFAKPLQQGGHSA
jgi:hypothetical protein